VLEAIRHVLWITSVVCIIALLTVEVQRAVRARHERAVDRYLMQVDANAMVLRIAVEEHAELEQGVGAVLDARDHGAGGESGLLDIAVEVLRIFVKDEAAKLV
jgi:predicted transposase YbfD/YdcC